MSSSHAKRSGGRLDERLLAENLAESRSKAQALIRSGNVLVNDRPVDKPGVRIPEDATLRVRGRASEFVSRGGDKLAGALDDLSLNPAGMRCLDIGASTGGFSDCLLQRGAERVIAVDVGYGQLDLKLRRDPRVHVLERYNARYLRSGDLPFSADWVCADLAFISLEQVLPAVAKATEASLWLLLVKPQFEVGAAQVGKGGVVRDPALRQAAVDQVARCAASLGFHKRAQVDSRVAGPKGNREIFLLLEPETAGSTGFPNA